MENSTTNTESLSNEVNTPDISGEVDEAVVGNDETPTNTDDENTINDQINTSDNTLTPTQVLIQKMINREPLTEYKESDTPNVTETNIEPVTDSPMCSGVVSTTIATRVMQYDKKRYWGMITNKEPLPFQELISKYDFNWCREPFLNNDGETLAHAYASYGVIPENATGEYGYNYSVWDAIYLLESPLTGKRVFDVALENNTIPPILFYKIFTGEREDDEEMLSTICPEALDMTLKDLILAIRHYNSNIIPYKVPDMELDNKFVKPEDSN